MANEKNCTLFVRGLPFDTTSGKLENVFSTIGPLKQCFVVDKPGNHFW